MTKRNANVTAIRAPGVDAAVNRELLSQGWKPHREMLSTGTPRNPEPTYSLYRKKLSEGEWAYLSPYGRGDLETLVLEVLGPNDLLYTDNVHRPSDASEIGESLASEIRACWMKPENIQEHQYLFSRPKPSEADVARAIESVKRRLMR